MAEEKKSGVEDHDNWKTTQKNAFVRWANEQLKRNRQVGVSGEKDLEIVDIETDLSDGTILIALVQVLSGKQLIRKIKSHPNLRTQKLENVTIALQYLQREEGVRIVNIDSSDIVDGNKKLILGLLWLLILQYSISRPVWDGDEDVGSKPQENDKTPKQRLLGWIQNKMPEDKVIKNFTGDWNDGTAIGALVNSIAPDLCPDWREWQPDNSLENATKAMTAAEEFLGIPQLIHPCDLVDRKVDEMSIMTYLSQFPNAKPKAYVMIETSDTSDPIQIGDKTTFHVYTVNSSSDMLEFDANVTDPLGKIIPVTIFNITPLHYRCSFVPQTQGQYTIKAWFARSEVVGSPLLVTVAPSVRLSEIKAYCSAEHDGTSDSFVSYTIDIKDGSAELLSYFINCPSSSSVESSLKEDDNGLYVITYHPLVDRPHELHIFYNAADIPESPFITNIAIESQMNGEVDAEEICDTSSDDQFQVQASKVRAFGEGLRAGCVGHRAMFVVNTEEAGSEGLSVTIDGPSEVQMTFNEVDFGYEISYVTPEAGIYFVSIRYAGIHHIPGSPFKVLFEETTVDYRVFVYTGDKFGAGTDAKVYLSLYGAIRDTGRIHLKSSYTHRNKFERNNMDEFLVHAVNIGDLVKIKVAHDNSGILGSPWYLDRIDIKSDMLDRTWTFQFGRWIARGELEVEMYPQQENSVERNYDSYKSPQVSSSLEEEIRRSEVQKISASNSRNEDEQITSSIELCTTSADDSAVENDAIYDELPTEIETYDPAKENDVDEICFCSTSNGITDLSDSVNTCESSNVDDETVIKSIDGDLLHANENGLLNNTNVVVLENCDDSNKASERYQILTKTGDKLFAGTDANVFINLIGDFGETGRFKLKTSTTHLNKFERDQLDEFLVGCPRIGELRSIKIGHDSTGIFGSSWFLYSVQVTNLSSDRSWYFPFKQWITKELSSDEDPETEIFPGEKLKDDNDDDDDDNDDRTSRNEDVIVFGSGLENAKINNSASFSVDASHAKSVKMLSVGVLGPKEPCNQVSTFYEGDGLYTITYQPCVRGTHRIVLKWGRQSIAGSPFKVVVV